MQNTEKTSIGDKINNFVQRNRKIIFLVLGVIIVLFIGSVVFLSLNDYLNKKAILEAEEFSRRYSELFLEDENAPGIDTLLIEINAFAKRKSGIAGGRAWSTIAQIHSDRKEWPQAEDAWVNAAKTASKTYLGPVAYFNAAIAAEEQGKLEEAILFFENCISHKFEFSASPRAQFSIGRLNEKLGNYSAAIEAYRAVLIKWPSITVWVNMAQSRIAALESR